MTIHEIILQCSILVLGGETIRQLQVQSGAHIELHRGAHPNPAEKLFNIRGEFLCPYMNFVYSAGE